MPILGGMRALLGALAACAVLLALPPATAEAGSAPRSCPRVSNPYAGTRYEGVDLARIRATGVSCATARRVARGAHRRALGLTPSGPVRRFTWNGWRVTGDLRGDRDAYDARKGDARVRWVF
jgi:hypothetical protein